MIVLWSCIYVQFLEHLASQRSLGKHTLYSVTALIMCLLTEYILDTVRSYQKSRFRVFLWCIIAGVFLATGGRNLLKIFHVGVSIPQMSTIQILLLTLAGSIVVGTFRKSGDKKEKKIQRIGLKPLFKRTGI